MKTLRFLAIAVCSLASARAAYVYDFPSLLNPYNASQWTQNGNIAVSSGLLTTTNIGSLILQPTVPGISNAYEVRTTIALPAGGQDNYSIYLRASSNAVGHPKAGTAYVAQIQSPTFSGAVCTAGLQVNKMISGVVTVLSSTTVPCANGMVFRGVMTQTNNILVYIDNVLYADVYDTSISSGQPGIEVEHTNGGDGLTTADIGHLDTVAPNPITSVTGSAFTDRVDLQWPSTTDDSNGIGLAYYTIWRNSTLVGQTASNYFSDFGMGANNTYAYSVKAVDYHGNAASTNQNITVPAAIIDPRETGVRPTGSYWGGGGEQIDMRSGNLNYTVPMMKGVGRGGWGVGFNLSYNSQNWRQDTAGTWQVGLDTGYGYGWRFQAGSLTPIYSSAWVLAGYLFIDATGAEYHLTVNTSGVWTSIESIYVYYDSTAGKLHFTDGSFWTFGSTSATTEQDAGTMYPTLMEDRNGNQVVVTYDNGQAAGTANTSSRINTIEDVRGKGSADYTFTYTYLNFGDPFPHLTGITNSIHTGEKFTLVYTDSSLISPFDHVTSFGTYAFLQSSTQRNMNPITFAYDSGGSGELNEVTVPYGGHLRWTYAPYTLANTLTYREVQNRYLSMSVGAAETLITLVRGNDSTYNVHQTATLDDSPANSEKYWTFNTNTTQPNGGLQLSYEERTLATHTPLSHLDFTWAQTPTTSNLYIGTTVTKLDPAQTYEADKQTVQTLDQYGNLTQVLAYNFGAGSVGSLARTYTNSIGTNSGYLPYYIFNRLTGSSVTDGTNTATLVQNNYDETALTSVTGLHEHDDTNYPATFTYRGNVTSYGTPTTYTVNTFDMAGNVTKTTVNGVATTVTTDSTTNYAAPTQVTTNTLGSGMIWSSFLGLSSATGPNGDSGSLNYDTTGRPSSVTSPYGAVTSYTYNDTASPPNKSSSTDGHWVYSQMDGFGRTTLTTTGYGSTTLSLVDVQYAPCGCSPLGKLSQQSQPYAPGGSDAWTVYHYDASGRTTSTVLPDGSATTYQYQGNQVTVTDPAGKWKTFTMDAFGNLVTVLEPDPVLGPVSTSYTYDVLNHLTQVSMPRGTTTQTRTFNYATPARHGNTVGGFLLSATNPENGTVTYTYTAANLLGTKTDAKGQQLAYWYDSYNRLTSVHWYNAPGGAQVLRTYYYDTNPLDPTGMFSQYALGRLTAVQYPQFATNVQMNDMYSYSRAGLPAAKRLQVNQLVAYDDINNHLQHQTVTVNLDSTYTYNDEGQATAMTYPSTIGVLNVVTSGASYNYSYDSMNRLGGMTDSNNNTIVSGVSYDAANRLLTMAFSNVNENRNYNVLGQLTQIWAPNVENILYNYPTGTNNGKVSSMYNVVSGETVTYAYDSLNRMATASGSGWAETYTLDPYGNLTTKQVTSGSGPSLSVSVNPGNNQLQGYGFNYDANGNAINSSSATPLAYDAENRLTGVGWNNQAPAVDYCYDAQNKRIFLWTAGTVDSFSNVYNYSVVFYSPSGQKLGTYLLAPQQPVFQPNGINTPYVTVSRVSSDQYFGGRRLAPMDQLGSAGTYYPWGEAKGGTNPQDTWSYATYWRDSATGLDYANNRYYSNAYGRFMTPDPYQASGGPGDPQSWNRYSYTRGDPVNRADPRGTDDCDADFCDDVWSWGDPFDGFWDIAGPFNNGPSFGYACEFGFLPGCNAAMQQAQVVNQLPVTYTPQLRVQTGGAIALSTLLTNAGCASLFGADIGSQLTGVPDPYTVMSDILNGTGYASIAYANMAPTSGSPSGNYTINNAITQPVLPESAGSLFASATITINTSQYAPFNFGSPLSLITDAVTLLHELGHVYEYLFGQSSTAILDDSTSSAISNANTTLVQTKCFPQISFPSN